MAKKNHEIVAFRIQEVKTKRLRFLDLQGLGLDKFPIQILELDFLFDIDLSFNYLQELPEDFFNLTNIQYLNLSHNNLSHLSFKLGKPYSFKEINISHNHFNFIPKELLNINVESIIYSNNPFTNNLPDELISSDDLYYIEYYLEALNKNKEVNKLFETKILLVGKGDVGKTTLSKVIMEPEFKVAVGEEKTTHGIDIKHKDVSIFFPAKKPYYRMVLDFNDLYVHSSFDESLEELDEISFNYLYEEYVPLPAILDNQELLADLRLMEEPYYDSLKCFFKREVRLNIWDFGGQEVLYSTHKFFLTKRSIYIFVWEPRSDTEEENFDYWLNVIKRLGGDSPVIIVMNKSDIRVKRIDEDSYRNKHKNIKSFFYVSCLTKEGINDLNQKLESTIATLPHLGDKLPNSWDQIRLKLQKLDREYISFDEFKEICELTKPENAYYISEYLTDLGDIIHFKSDFSLRNIVILNPKWLTKAIYELIQNRAVQNKQGFFSADELVELLDQKKYPTKIHLELISLMEKFEICFKITGSGNDYIIPSLLNVSIPNSILLSEFGRNQTLKYKVAYQFLINGIIERLICRLNYAIEKNNFWKYGVVFNTENNRALVILNKAARKIDITVTGETPSFLLNVIVHELKIIHDNLKLSSNDFDEMIPCNCSECQTNLEPYYFSKKTLLKFKEKEKDIINCYISADDVYIQELLIGYKPIKKSNSLVYCFIRAMSSLQTRHKLVEGFNEDGINTYFQDLLATFLPKGMITNEQALRGKSATGFSQGRLDISVDSVDTGNVSFFEGFILNSFVKKNIDDHVAKSLINYDPNGLKEKFIGVYYRGKNFVQMFSKFMNHMLTISVDEIQIISIDDLSAIYVSASEMKVIRINYNRSETKLTLYIILANMNL